jgi:uncharacterized membrane protein YbhN (UPF0104 family)
MISGRARIVDGVLSGPDVPAPAGSRTFLRRRWVHSALVVLVVGLLVTEGALLAPHLRGTARAVGHVNWPLLLLAVAAEAGSMTAFAGLYRQMLRGGGLTVGLGRLAATVLAANALSATLPAGSALATGYTFQRMRRFGASVPLAGWVVVISGLVSGASLAVLGVVGALVMGTQSAGMWTALAAAAATVAVAVAVRTAARHPRWLTAVGHHLVRGANRLLRRDAEAGRERVHEAVANLVAIRPRAVDWFAAAGFAALNWAGDIACLVLACHAVGITDLSARTVLLAYAADAAVGSLQLLPGGIGTVDGAIVLALVKGGVSAESAAAGVLIYRLISFVLAAAVGWIVWLFIRDRGISARAQLSAPSIQRAPSRPAATGPPRPVPRRNARRCG